MGTHRPPGWSAHSGWGSRRGSQTLRRRPRSRGQAAAGPGSSSPALPGDPDSAESAHGSNARTGPKGKYQVTECPLVYLHLGRPCELVVVEPSKALRGSGSRCPCPSRTVLTWLHYIQSWPSYSPRCQSPLCQNAPLTLLPLSPSALWAPVDISPGLHGHQARGSSLGLPQHWGLPLS